MRSIRRAVLLGAAVVAIVAAFTAVSIARTPSDESASAPATPTPAMVEHVGLERRGIPAIPDEAAMVLIGAGLFGVAAAVKRAA